jgi:hypothetical protein
VRRLRQLAQADVLNDDVDFVGRRVGHERFEARLCSFWAIVASAKPGSRKRETPILALDGGTQPAEASR